MEDEGKSKLDHGMPITRVFYLCTPSPTHHKLQANNIGGSWMPAIDAFAT
jgi:hypothetical protein